MIVEYNGSKWVRKHIGKYSPIKKKGDDMLILENVGKDERAAVACMGCLNGLLKENETPYETMTFTESCAKKYFGNTDSRQCKLCRTVIKPSADLKK